VVDLFEDDAGDAANRTENAQHYTGFTLDAFQANYRAAHGHCP